MINFEDLKRTIFPNLKLSGAKGWFVTDCPYCKKDNHFGIKFEGKVPSFNCFKCNQKGNIFKLLRFLGKISILDELKTISINAEIKNKILIQQENNLEIQELKKISKPICFKRIKNHSYMEYRKVSEKIFELYEIGFTEVDLNLKNYIIIIMKNNNNQIVGWIGRSILSNDKIARIERKTGKKYLRYLNSQNSDFSKYLLGITEFTQNTDTVIIVEGIFDKFRIDTILELYSQEHIKCVCTFGKKISDYQIFILQNCNISNIILLYDPDAINASKEYSLKLSLYFNVNVGFLKDKDPGDLEINELFHVLENLETPLQFNKNKILKNKLL